MSASQETYREYFGAPCAAITRRRLIADGTLIDATATARLFTYNKKTYCFPMPVAFTAEAWAAAVEPSGSTFPYPQVQSIARGHDLRGILKQVYEANENYDVVREIDYFNIIAVARTYTADSPVIEVIDVPLLIVRGPGDTMDPVLTVMLPNQS